MAIKKNMEFKIKDGFLPNLCLSKSLKVLDVSDSSIIIEMGSSQKRGVFPPENFNYWINKGILIAVKDHQKRIS
ncbi:hypothetical protein MKX83_11635 [Cytobacillus sp. FSL M8-0252]|uniref:hypothetical protein n=1 Tax=Cytobacillus sp. FSL M8-0252 TaxID=2921621 RepID=UPI0030F59127